MVKGRLFGDVFTQREGGVGAMGTWERYEKNGKCNNIPWNNEIHYYLLNKSHKKCYSTVRHSLGWEKKLPVVAERALGDTQREENKRRSNLDEKWWWKWKHSQMNPSVKSSFLIRGAKLEADEHRRESFWWVMRTGTKTVLILLWAI